MFDQYMVVSATLNSNVQTTLYWAESVAGPWYVSYGLHERDGTNKFFRAEVHSGLVQFEGNFVGVDYMAVRLPSLTNVDQITTKSGFVLDMYRSNWWNGISIFKITDGPATTDIGSDYAKLFADLWEDDRTDFVAPVTPTISAGGGLCFMGYMDELLIGERTPDYTAEDLAQFDLQELSRSTGFIVVRWLKPKSLRLEQFLENLRAAGFSPQVNGVGCAS